MKQKYRKYSEGYMLYIYLRHIYGKSLGFTYKRYKDRWRRLSQLYKHRQEIMTNDLSMEYARRFRNES